MEIVRSMLALKVGDRAFRLTAVVLGAVAMLDILVMFFWSMDGWLGFCLVFGFNGSKAEREETANAPASLAKLHTRSTTHIS